MSTRPRRSLVVTVLVDGMSALEPAVADDFFGVDRRYLGVPWYRYRVCSETPTVRIGSHLVTVEHGLEAIERADTVVIPGWSSVDDRPSESLVDAVRCAHRRGARLISFCTGAVVLAEAGLLDRLPATTHWAAGDRFSRRYPKVDLCACVLFVDNGQILTSAGAAASIDLALHVIRSDFGAEIANRVARAMVVPAHRDGGQPQFVTAPVPAGAGDLEDPVGATMAWAAERLDQPLSVEDLASRAALSPRQFTRLFRARTGTTPHQWVLNQRVALAQRLLETTDLPVEQVATASGVGTGAALRLLFQRTVRMSPIGYRRAYRERRAG